MNKKEAIKKIKSQYNIVDYMNSTGLNLQQRGNSWVALCPFHNEKTPSFHVSEDFQNYRCFGCGEHGDIINYAEKIHTVSSDEALKMLAEEKGIDIGSISKDDGTDIPGIKKVLEDAAFYYREVYKRLPDSHPAKVEVSKRGLDPNKEIYGFSPEKPNELYKYLKSKGHTDKNIEESKLVLFYEEENRQPWDFFHGRLMITLCDYLGKPVSFTARKIFEGDRMPGKYVNGKESKIFLKKNNLFGADTAKKAARAEKLVYVVEGQFDRESMYENGIKNVVASSGTAFTQEHANLLLRMVGESGKVVFIMDGDSAGVKAALKIFKSSPVLHSNSHAVLLEGGQDPCDFIMSNGIEKFKEKIQKTTPISDFVIEMISISMGGKINLDNRNEFVSEVCTYAKYSSSKQIIEHMLSRASITSAFSIESVREIYNGTKVNRTSQTSIKKEETNDEREKEGLKIKMNSSSEADMCMYTALALLVRMPDKLLQLTPEKYHKKYKIFLEEIKRNFNETKLKNTKWRFIPEEYEDSSFARILQEKEFISDPRDDESESVEQYLFLFKKANEIYKYEYDEFRKSQALSSISKLTDPKEIAETLRYYQEISK